MAQVTEITGFSGNASIGSGNVARRYFIEADSPELAKSALEIYAANIAPPNNFRLSEVSIDEERSATGLYFGTVTFATPNPLPKNIIAADLQEVFGDSIGEPFYLQ